ncbi:MAG: MFS transporter [Pseudomonadota bacterium]
MDEGAVQTAEEPEKWDNGYEYRVVGLMAAALGLVGLDRYFLFPLFPVISEDLGLTYQDLGLISCILALTWGLASVFTGNLADRFGANRIIIISVIAFSALVAFTGLATGLISLLLLRAMMGFAEGGFTPASIVQTMKVSKPSRLGLNFGFRQMSAPFVGLGLGPLIAVSLLAVLPGWEWVFGVIALPGFLVAFLIWRTVRADGPPAVPEMAPAAPKVSLLEPLKYRNVVFGTFALICFFSISSMASGTIATLVGPLIGGSVPAVMAATATGIVVGIGEILGGAGGSAFAGYVADTYGIEAIDLIMLVGGALGLIAVLFGIQEPQKQRLAATAASPDIQEAQS